MIPGGKDGSMCEYHCPAACMPGWIACQDQDANGCPMPPNCQPTMADCVNNKMSGAFSA